LTLDELGEMVLESLKKMLKDRKDFVVSLFKAADTDMSGKVDFSEWQCLMYEMDPDCRNDPGKVRRLFRKCVEDQEDDTIDIDKFAEVMREAKLDRPQRHAAKDKGWGFWQEMFNSVDEDGSEKMNEDKLDEVLVRLNASEAQVAETRESFRFAVKSEGGMDDEQFFDLMSCTSLHATLQHSPGAYHLALQGSAVHASERMQLVTAGSPPEKGVPLDILR